MLETQMNSDELFDALKYQRTVNESGDIQYRNSKGFLHREEGPAMISGGGKRLFWYKNGSLHRTDGPAIVYLYPNGPQFWYINGEQVSERHARKHRESDGK